MSSFICYVEYQLIHIKKRNIVIINVYCPPDCPTEKFSSHLNELRTKLIDIGNSMPNIIFTGFTADGGTHENKIQANAFLQFAQEQCLRQYIEEPTRKITYSMSFSLIMTNSPGIYPSPKHQ